MHIDHAIETKTEIDLKKMYTIFYLDFSILCWITYLHSIHKEAPFC